MFFKSLLIKGLPYILIAGLCATLYFGFVHMSSKIEDLTNENITLTNKNNEINNNYTTLQNMYAISMKQVEELQKQQKESIAYVVEIKTKMLDIDLKKSYNEDAMKLLDKINNYEKCMAEYFRDPYHYCYIEGDK